MFKMIAVVDLAIVGSVIDQCPNSCSTSCTQYGGTFSGGGLICNESVGCQGLEGSILVNGGDV
jgi:hypothetical protein